MELRRKRKTKNKEKAPSRKKRGKGLGTLGGWRRESNHLGERWRRGKTGAWSIDTHTHRILGPKDLYLEVSEEDLNRIFISFPDGSLVVSTDWSVPGGH